MVKDVQKTIRLTAKDLEVIEQKMLRKKMVFSDYARYCLLEKEEKKQLPEKKFSFSLDYKIILYSVLATVSIITIIYLLSPAKVIFNNTWLISEKERYTQDGKNYFYFTDKTRLSEDKNHFFVEIR